MVTGIAGIGMERRSIENVHNDVANGVADVMFSCIRRNKPIRVSGVANTNDATWLSNMAIANRTNTPFSITWPPEVGYTTGGSVSWIRAGLTDYSMGSPDIEGRVNCEFTIMPAGLPTIVAGTFT